jgi:hypothetical protein
MPKPTSKSRQELRSRFVRNAIPTEADFAELIAASLNQADDGVLKLPDQPLGLVRQKPEQPVLRFFADPAAEGSVWQLQLGAGDKPGFGLAGADGKLALLVDGAKGNVGIGTANPGNKLTIQGNFNDSRDLESGITNGGLVALKGNAPQIDFIDTEHGDWAIHVNEGRMYFIREPWEHQDLVLDGKGNIGIGSSVPQAKLNIRELTGTPASALSGTLLLDHEDAGGASSIVFRSKVNRGSDHAFIEFRDKNPLIDNVEAALLTIGMQNDPLDHIALMPSGNVGVGTTTPCAKLQITGNVSITSAEGQNIACINNFMAAGSLTIGGIDRNYGGGTSWSNNTAGLLLETLDNTEIAIHDSNLRVASFMYYESASNRFTIGRDMGWGAISTVNVQGDLQVNGQTNILTGSNPIRFSSVWTAFPDDKTNGAEICNDTDRYKTLMIVGNNSKGEGRRVGIWDRLDVFGGCDVMGLLVARNGVDAYGRCNVTGLLHVNGPATKEDENKPQLEVYAPDSGDFSSYTKIRFHQGNQYWGWLGYHGLSKNDNGEFVFWNQNQSKVARIRCGDLAAKGAVVRSIWAGSGNGPTEMGDMGRLHSRTIRINKLFPETALRIVYCDNFRVNGDNVACRWEIRVDGNSVNPPILADRYESSGNRHLHGTVMGYARGVAAGAREIQVWIVPHPHNQGRGTDVETGWSASTWSLEAEEVWLA